MRKNAVLLIVIVVVIGFLNYPIKAKAYPVDLKSFETDKVVYFSDETIQVNASWELDYSLPIYDAFGRVRIYNESYELLWNSTKLNQIGNFSSIWNVEIQSLGLGFYNYSIILYVEFWQYYFADDIPIYNTLGTIEITLIKRNVSCELIGFDNHLKYNKGLNFGARFYNTSYGSGYYVRNQQILFEILLENFTIIFSRNYFTNGTGEVEIFVLNIKNLSVGINYLQFTVIDNQFFKSEVFQFEFYFEVRPAIILDLKEDKKEKKDNSEINQVLVVSVSLTVSVSFGIILFLYYRNMKKKPRDLQEITFKY